MPMTFFIVQGVGLTELLIVLAILLVFFGPKRLPALGRQVGAGVRDLRAAVLRRHDLPDDDDDDPESPTPPAARRELPAGDR